VARFRARSWVREQCVNVQPVAYASGLEKRGNALDERLHLMVVRQKNVYVHPSRVALCLLDAAALTRVIVRCQWQLLKLELGILKLNVTNRKRY